MSWSFKFFGSTNRSGAASDQVTAILPASARTFISDRMSEFCGVALALVATFFLVAVISYQPGDPSLNSATNLAPANLLGHSGATIADILVQSFGYAAYLSIIGLLGWSWRIIRKQHLSLVGWRGVALIVATVTAGIGLSSLPVADDWPLPTHMGGVAGTLIHDRSISFLAAAGWPHGGLQIGIAAAFMAVLFWVFGVVENKERVRTTKRLRLFTNRNLLAKSEIHNLQVTVLVNHQILGFQVTIHVSRIMNMSESSNDLSSIYTSCNLLETSQTNSR